MKTPTTSSYQGWSFQDLSPDLSSLLLQAGFMVSMGTRRLSGQRSLKTSLWYCMRWKRQYESEKMAYECLDPDAWICFRIRMNWIFWFPLQMGFAELRHIWLSSLKEHTHNLCLYTRLYSHIHKHSVHIHTYIHSPSYVVIHMPTHKHLYTNTHVKSYRHTQTQTHRHVCTSFPAPPSLVQLGSIH